MVGFFNEAVELAKKCGYEIIGCVVPSANADNISIPILGREDSLGDFVHNLIETPAFLTPDQPAVRRRLQILYTDYGISFASLISPQARISESAQVEKGCSIQGGAHISSGAKIGEFVRINVAANLMHDVCVGEFSTIAPNACILGNARIGALCYIGANSTILPGLTIGEGAIVGAGAVVTRNVAPNTVVAGNPARVLRSS